MVSIWSVLARNRDFRRLFLAELVMFGGDWFVIVPLLGLLQRLTGGGLYGGLVLAMDTGVNALLLPVAGTVADRLDRRRIMLVANGASAVAVLALLLVRSRGTAVVALLAIGAAAAAKAFYIPAGSAALPNLVDPDELAAANVLSGSVWGTMVVVGASLGGVAAAVVGPYPCFVMAVACLVVAVILVWRVRRPTQSARDAGAPVQPTLRAIAEATRYIGHRPRIVALVTVKSATGVGNGVLTTFPLLATVVFGLGPAGTGLLFAARGLGALIGPMLLRRIVAKPGWLLPCLAVSMAGYGVGYLGVGLAPWFWLALPLVVLAHIAGGGNWAMSTLALQTEVPDALRGRVLATDVMLASLAVSVSQLGVGALVDHVSARLLVAACGGLTLAYAVGWWAVTRRFTTRDPIVPGGDVPGGDVSDPTAPGGTAATGPPCGLPGAPLT